MTRSHWIAIAIVVTSAWPAAALAHPAVDEGRRLFEEAEFLESLDAFARAEAAEDLERDDLVALFETRALVHLAMGNEGPMQADLARLVAIAPDHALDRRAPPEVRRAFAAVRSESRGPIRLRISTELATVGATITAELENDPQGLVRQVRVFGRLADATEWQRADDAPLLVSGSGVISYYAEAVGPGGVALAASGSREAPLRLAGASAAPVDEPAGDDSGVWIALGVIAAALVVGAGVTVAVVLVDQGGGDTTNVQPFTVRF